MNDAISWKKIWSKRHSIRLSENWCYGSHDFERFFGVAFPDQIIALEKSFGSGYVDEKQLQQCIAYLIKAIETDGFEKVFGKGEKILEEFLDFSKSISSPNIDKLTNKALLDVLDTYLSREDEWMHYMWLVFILDEGLTARLYELSAEPPSSNFEQVLQGALRPAKKTAAGILKQELLELYSEESQGKNIEVALQKVADKFAYFSILNMDEEPLAFPYFEQEYQKVKQEIANPQQEIEQQKKREKTVALEFDKQLTQFSSEVVNILKATQRVAYLRERRNDIRQESYVYSRNLYMEIARRADLSIGDIIYCTRAEVRVFLEADKSLPSKAELDKRKAFSMLSSVDEKVTYTFDQNQLPEFLGEKDVEKI